MQFRVVTSGFLVPLALLSLAGVAFSQPLVYSRVPGSCGRGGCGADGVRLTNSANGHALATFGPASALPAGFDTGTGLDISSDGTRLFQVTRSGSSQGSGALFVFDALQKTTIGQVPLGLGSSDIAVLPDNSRAYVTNTAANTVSVVDLETLTVVATVTVGTSPSRIVAVPDGSAVYVTNSGSGTVSKISTGSHAVAATIQVGSTPIGLDVNPEGSRLFVANSGSFSVSVIDALSDSVLRVIPAGGGTIAPVDVAAISGTRLIAAFNDSAVTGTGNGVQLMDAASGAVLGSAATAANTGVARPNLRLARDASATAIFVLDGVSAGRISSDGNLVSAFLQTSKTDLAVLNDPCAFEAAATPATVGGSGGSGTVSIPAAAGCAWSVSSSAAGVTFAGPTAGTGPSSVAFTVPASTAGRTITFDLGRQTLLVEQLVASMGITVVPASPAAQPLVIRGWAFEQPTDLSAPVFTPDRCNIDSVHVWAYPASGPPAFLGAGFNGSPPVPEAPDQLCGFSFAIRTLPAGSYTLVFYAISERSHAPVAERAITLTVLPPPPAHVVIDAPVDGAVFRAPFSISGWAIDPTGAAYDPILGTLPQGPGVNAVHVWAYPDGGGEPAFVGAAQYGGPRPDVATAFGSGYLHTGYQLDGAVLPPGSYTLVVFARNAATFAFTARARRITVSPSPTDPLMHVDIPGAGSIQGPFTVAGWAIDRGAPSGSGVDTVHVWAVPAPGGGGSTPVFLGVAPSVQRLDVGAAFGSRFASGGFGLTGATLSPGTYDLIVFAHSIVTGTFNNARVVRIVVP